MSKSLKAQAAELVNGQDSNVSQGEVFNDTAVDNSNEGVDVAPSKKASGGKSATRKKAAPEEVAEEVVAEPAKPFTLGLVENNESPVQWIDGKDVVLPENGLNIRTEYGDLKELAASIKANGIKIPLRGYMNAEGKFVAVHGHRRTTAIQMLLAQGVEVRVPVMLEADGTTDAQRVIEMFITNDGKQLEPLEKAEGVNRLKEGGMKTKEVAAALGVTERYIQKLLKFHNAPEQLKGLVKNGVISFTYAMDIMSQGEEAIADIIRRAEEGSLRGDGAYDGQDDEGAESDNRITKSDEVKGKNEDNVNSLQALKKYIGNTDDATIHEEKAPFFAFMMRVINNEVSERAINLWFKKPI